MEHARVASLREGERVELLFNTGVMRDGYPWFLIRYRTRRAVRLPVRRHPGADLAAGRRAVRKLPPLIPNADGQGQGPDLAKEPRHVLPLRPEAIAGDPRNPAADGRVACRRRLKVADGAAARPRRSRSQRRSHRRTRRHDRGFGAARPGGWRCRSPRSYSWRLHRGRPGPGGSIAPAPAPAKPPRPPGLWSWKLA